MKSFAINLFLGVTWLFLSAERSAFNFAVGFFLGFLILLIFQDILGTRNYVRRVFAFFRWLFNFLSAFILSNLAVAKIVLFSKIDQLNPGFFHYDISGLNEVEVVILSQTITLTPGTTAVEPDMEKGLLLIHVLDGADIEAAQQAITRQLRDPLLAFLRG